jgi:hypothetical protein
MTCAANGRWNEISIVSRLATGVARARVEKYIPILWGLEIVYADPRIVGIGKKDTSSNFFK